MWGHDPRPFSKSLLKGQTLPTLCVSPMSDYVSTSLSLFTLSSSFLSSRPLLLGPRQSRSCPPFPFRDLSIDFYLTDFGKVHRLLEPKKEINKTSIW